MQETLRMVFRNFDGRLTAITLIDPDSEISAQDVTDVMNSIVSKNVFQTTGGDIVSKVRAEVVTRGVDVLEEF